MSVLFRRSSKTAMFSNILNVAIVAQTLSTKLIMGDFRKSLPFQYLEKSLR